MDYGEQLEQRRKELQAVIERQDTLRRLLGNRDFQKLIMQEFCIDECAKYAHASADPTLDANQRADALGIAQSSGHLRRWLNIIDRMADVAANDIKSIDIELDEFRANPEAYAEQYHGVTAE